MQQIERKEVSFTREQFYAKVWSLPTTTIAADLGCSDVLIGKLCREYNIPKPYVGYWAMLEHGKNPAKLPLPKDDRPEIQLLKFHGHPQPTEAPKPQPVFDPDILALLEKAAALPPVEVASTLSRPHPLIQVTRERLKAHDKPYYKQTPEEQHDRRPMLDVSASPTARTRALCIFDAFIKRIEQIGGQIKIVDERRAERNVVFLAGEEVHGIRLRERNRQVRLPPDPNRTWGPNTELQPTGMLLFDKGPSYFGSVLLSDTPKRPLESGLGEMIMQLIQEVGRERIRRRQEEEARKRREEEDRIRRQQEEELRKRRDDLKRRQHDEQIRLDALVRDANAWQQSRTIRRYLHAIETMLIERDGAIPTQGQVAEYLAWAQHQADRMDPLKPSPPSVLDEHM